MAKKDIDVLEDIAGFGLGILYQILLICFHIVLCILFVLKLLFSTPFLEFAVPIGCGISILVTTIDLILSLRYCIISRMWVFLLIDIWFFARYTMIPVILLILSLVF